MKKSIVNRGVFIAVAVIIFILSGWLYVDVSGLKQSLKISEEIVFAQTGPGSALEKIMERINKAGLKPREARYYKVLEQKQ